MVVEVEQETRVGRLGLIIAWVVVLLASLLPKVVLQEFLGIEVPTFASTIVSAAVVLIALAVSLAWHPLRPLLPFFILFLVLIGAEWLVYSVVDQLPVYRDWLSDPSFAVSMPAEQSLRLMVTVLVVATLLALRRRPSRFFLVPGRLSAPVQGLRFLGAREGTRWSRFGPIVTILLTGATLAFLIVAGAPQLDLVAQAAPLLPVVLIVAALNAFNEEVTYKASFLSVLEGPVGQTQTLLMVATYFGIGHFYGVPYGLVGVAMAFGLALLLGRSMLDTRGLFWAWFIHFWQDVLIFSFLALGSIKAGG